MTVAINLRASGLGGLGGDGAAGVAGSLFTSEILKLLEDSRDA
ncbi:MAG: hypothetical protein ACK53I_04550 [Phenylobacterium sp.]